MVRTCSKCIMDSMDDPFIIFNKDGVCNHCVSYEINVKKYYKGADPKLKEFLDTIKQLKKAGEGKKYDVIIGDIIRQTQLILKQYIKNLVKFKLIVSQLETLLKKMFLEILLRVLIF